jgi:hypothetical protein
MEPPSSSNDDQTQYQAQSWNGPEAGHWLVQEPRYQTVAVAALLVGWTPGYAGLYYVVGLRARSPEALTALVPLFVPISLLSTAYVPASLLPGWVRSAAAVNPYGHVVDTVRAARTGTLDAGQLAAGLAAVTAAVALTSWPPPAASPASSTATDQPRNGRYHHATASPHQQPGRSASPCRPGHRAA